jgi:hypothetical protein
MPSKRGWDWQLRVLARVPHLTTFPCFLSLSLKHSLRVPCCAAPCAQAPFVDPVRAADGHTYERAAIHEHLRLHRTSPLTGRQLTVGTLRANLAVRVAVEGLLLGQQQ